VFLLRDAATSRRSSERRFDEKSFDSSEKKGRQELRCLEIAAGRHADRAHASMMDKHAKTHKNSRTPTT